MLSNANNSILSVGNKPSIVFAAPRDTQLQLVIDKIRENQHLALFDINKSTEKDIGKFGLRTAEDVKAFIKTPMAKAELSKYANQLSVSKELLEESLFEMLMKQLLKMFLLAAMRHAKSNKNHKQQQLNESYQHQIDEKKEKQLKKLADLHAKPELHMQVLNQYDTEINSISQKIENIQLEQRQLEQQIVELNDAITEIENRYEGHYHNLETVATLFENPSTTPEILEQYLETIGVQIENFSQGIGTMHTAPDLIDSAVQQQSIHDQQALLMHSHAIHNHLNVLRGTHCYLDHEGNTVHHHNGFRDAVFVVPIEEQIQRHNNELILVPRNKVPEELTEEERHESKLRLKPMQTIKAILQDNQANELNQKIGGLKNILTAIQDKKIEQNALEKTLKAKNENRKAFVNTFKHLLVEGLNTFDNMSSTEKMLNEFSKIPQSPFKMTPAPRPKVCLEDEKLLNSPVRVPVNNENFAKLIALLPAAQNGALNKLLEQINRMNNTPKPDAVTTPFSMKPK